MEIWGKTCTDCNWNAVCTHKKILWDGKEYQYVTACCRAMTGETFIPTSCPDEPQDWDLWNTLYKKGLIIYGREQLVSITEDDFGLVLDSPGTSTSRASKVQASAPISAQRNTVARPLAGLKSVYDTGPSDQGSLF